MALQIWCFNGHEVGMCHTKWLQWEKTKPTGLGAWSLRGTYVVILNFTVELLNFAVELLNFAVVPKPPKIDENMKKHVCFCLFRQGCISYRNMDGFAILVAHGDSQCHKPRSCEIRLYTFMIIVRLMWYDLYNLCMEWICNAYIRTSRDGTSSMVLLWYGVLTL